MIVSGSMHNTNLFLLGLLLVTGGGGDTNTRIQVMSVMYESFSRPPDFPEMGQWLRLNPSSTMTLLRQHRGDKMSADIINPKWLNLMGILQQVYFLVSFLPDCNPILGQKVYALCPGCY